ncbi:MAG: SPASM domain-containing protein, partial [Thermoplasmata archaeon]|nr:SPASM domain-containing protein [Thermoplasmata archaeon]
VTGKQFGEFYKAIFDEWVRNDVGEMFVQMFDLTLAAWVGQPGPVCTMAPTCGNAMALEHNGDLYSCDHYVEPGHLLGNIMETPLEQLVDSSEQRAFGLAKMEGLPDVCMECNVRFACQGGCPRNRLVEMDDDGPDLNHLCEGYKAFFTHVDKPMEFMAGELRSGRDPANVMKAMDKISGKEGASENP